jgi:hypothetical protein
MLVIIFGDIFKLAVMKVVNYTLDKITAMECRLIKAGKHTNRSHLHLRNMNRPLVNRVCCCPIQHLLEELMCTEANIWTSAL